MQVHALASRRARTTVAVRAAIYARVSSDQQAERHTIDSQVEALLARAAADGHEIQAELRCLDDGQSGASLIRPALERLRDLAAMGAIDVVYVHAPDRLARSFAHQAVLIEEFARAGTEVVFRNRPIGQTPEDTLLLQLQGMFAEYERARIVERSRRGKRHLAEAGAVSVLGRAPYGYRYVGRHEPADGKARFEVVEEEAAVIRRMFEWVGQERASLAVVCQRLFEAGVPSPTGKARWGESMVSALLTNPAYAGHARFGRRATAPWQPPLRPPRGRAPIPKHPRRRVLAPAEQWISIPVPALIDAALFQGTQEQLGENRRRRRQRKAGARYLLQGLLVCQTCGYALCGRWKASLRSPEQGVPLLPLRRDGQPSLRRPAPMRCQTPACRAAGRGGLGRGVPLAREPGPRRGRIPTPLAGRAQRAASARVGDAGAPTRQAAHRGGPADRQLCGRRDQQGGVRAAAGGPAPAHRRVRGRSCRTPRHRRAGALAATRHR